MSKISEIIYLLDKATFIGIRQSLGGGWLDELTTLSGNIVFWMPLFALLVIYLSMSRPRIWWLEVFFGMAAFIMAFQIATLLSRVFVQPAPYVVENILHGTRLPAFVNEYAFNLPDWTMASMVATIRYTRLRLRNSMFPLPGWLVLFPLFLAFSRILPGYAYPMDVLSGWMIGMIIAFFMHHVARNVTVLAGGSN
jgi:membrane-associated phospholipid phosphatase